MALINKSLSAVLVAAALVAASVVVGNAQEISESKLAIARQVAINAPSPDFDGILPDLAVQTKDRLIRLRPDLYKEISSAVDATAMNLIARRNDLDGDIARVWARNFSEDELKSLNDFFSSDVGKKYRKSTGTLGNEIVKASQNWANRLSGELYDRSLEELKKQGIEF